MDILFPITTGAVVDGLDGFLTGRGEAWAEGVTVGRYLPSEPERTARMVAVRDDGGPEEGPLKRTQVGVNVWAESVLTGERLARLLMAGMRTLPDGNPITAVDSLAGPFEVTDTTTDLVVVDGVTLSHFFFTARVSTRGTNL